MIARWATCSPPRKTCFPAIAGNISPPRKTCCHRGVNDRIAKVTTDVASLRVSVFTFGPLILALLVKLVFFP